MYRDGTWAPYSGIGALALTAALSAAAALLAYLGFRLRRPITVTRPGVAVSAFLVTMWAISLATLMVAAGAYMGALNQQYGKIDLPKNPISPITAASGLATFALIAWLTGRRGLRVALGSALAGTIAAPMIFELPFDLIVMARTYPPSPPVLFTLLFFLPLFLLEISSFSLLTLTPAMRVSRYSLFSLAAMFAVFAAWALAGFSYPSRPTPFALNAISKVLSFVVAITLFLPGEKHPGGWIPASPEVP